ncbi:MAG: RNA methyltransferase [Treponema sp.]|jgi:TrmH RNA methyltransferase|nr:RNA methyltransferase [Treponema sp.]
MRNKLTDELAVCGLNAVRAAAEYHPEKINRLFLREDRLKLFSGICSRLAERKRPYKLCGDEEMERICKSAHHQGVVAMIIEPEIERLGKEDLERWAHDKKTGIVLCSVGNDHNLGAIVRAAAFFDCSYMVISSDDPGASLTTSAYRVAEGGMEHVTIRRVENVAAFLRDASRLLLTIGTDVRARRRIRDLPDIAAGMNAGGPERSGTVLVMGNEESGLPRAVKDACSVLLRIPGTGLMESLNVAQAAALFLHEIYEM